MNNYRYFVYSDMQIEFDKQIANKLGKQFVCGTVSIGSEDKLFTKLVDEKGLASMAVLYPDTVIVTQGQLNEFIYNDPRYEFIS